MWGIGLIDEARVELPAEVPLEFCALHLKLASDMPVEVFQGSGFIELRRALQRQFQALQTRKPAASRNRSDEICLLAQGERA